MAAMVNQMALADRFEGSLQVFESACSFFFPISVSIPITLPFWLNKEEIDVVIK